MKSSDIKETEAESFQNESLDDGEEESTLVTYEIPPLASIADKNLYTEIKEKVLNYITRSSHGYKPKKGDCIIFPTAYTHTHRGNPPIGGDKYIITGWVEF